jgi:predicted RNase H-like HicB family nuclease
MNNEFTAIIERDDGWLVAYCPEVPGANGQGRTKEDCLKSLSEAIKLILEDRREEAFRRIPDGVVKDVVKLARNAASF